MSLFKPLSALLFAASTTCHAIGCDELLAEIDAKIRPIANLDYSLTVTDMAGTAPGRVVGSCENGTKKILYLAIPSTRGAAASAVKRAPAPAGSGGVLTECKPGFSGPDCKSRDDRP